MLRLTPPGFERLLQSPQFQATFGGGEANVAVSLAQFGGREPLHHGPARCQRHRRRSSSANCAVLAWMTAGCARPRRMGVYFVEAGANQRPAKVLYDRDHSAISLAKPGSIHWHKALHGATWFHITGITPAISASAAELALESLHAARALGITISCDLNYRKNLWKWGKPANEVMPELVKLVDICIANEEDCQKCINVHVDIDVESGSLERQKYQELCERVLATYPNLKMLAVTLRESRSASI